MTATFDSALSSEQLLDCGIRAVAFASCIATAVQSKHRGAGKADFCAKTDASPVTVADFAVQCLITEFLAISTGVGMQLRLLGEEDAELLSDRGSDSNLCAVAALLNEFFPFAEAARMDRRLAADRKVRPRFSEEDVLALLRRAGDAGGREGQFWVLDPIDGTKGFIRDAQYAIGLGLVDRGVPLLGVVGCPNLGPIGSDPTRRHDDGGYIFCALQDLAGELELKVCLQRCSNPGDDVAPLQSSFRRISSCACPVANAVLCESFESTNRSKDELRSRSDLIRQMTNVRLDSMTKYALVARGDAHVYLRGCLPRKKEENIWDHCAGMKLLLAAGGRVTDFDGQPLDFGVGRALVANEGVLATNGMLHDEILAEIGSIKKTLSDSAQLAKQARLA